jgi:hypothetical protein
MHYVTQRFHKMQNHKFSVTCPDTLFVKSLPVPPEHKNKCIDVSHPGRTGMHYVAHISDRIQKHKFGVTCPDMLFLTSPTPA